MTTKMPEPTDRRAAPTPGPLNGDKCHARGPLGAWCELFAHHDGVHRTPGPPRIHWPAQTTYDAKVTALRTAKDSIGALVSAIEQHHATSTCASETLFSEADRQYRVLEMIRAVLALADEKPA